MEKRVIIAVVLCVAVLMLWSQFFPAAPPPASPPQKDAPGATASKEPAPSQGAAPAAAPTAAAPGGDTPTPGAAPAERPERKLTLGTPHARYVFSTRGGTLVHAELLEPQFRDSAAGHDVVRVLDTQQAPMKVTFPDSAFRAPADAAWEARQPSPDAVTFTAESGGVHLEKRYRLDQERYRLTLEVAVANRGDKAVEHHLALALTGRQDPDKRGGGFFSGPSANPASALCYVHDDLERKMIDDLAKDPLKAESGNVRWIAVDEKFFMLAAVPHPENPPANRSCSATSIGPDLGQVTVTFAARTVAPGQETIYPFTIFAGPKLMDELEKVQPGGQEARLEKAVDVTLAFISRPILSLLNLFHRVVHNWGLAIVLLTIFIKIVTFYPTQKALISGKRMQKLAPKMAAIRKKYESDRQRMSMETMNLYKSHGVSPFGGCLPSLIQMPIWIALYSTLNYAVELYRAPFFLHIRDLTAKDPFYVTPLVMGVVMFLQMKMTPTGADSQQQAMMTVMMPIMFTAFSLFLPSGLAVYMLTSYLIGILQQLYVNHLDRKGAIQV